MLPSSTSSVKVTGVDRTMTETTVFCTATLQAGGEQSYEVHLLRDGISWKVASVSAVYPSQGGVTPVLGADSETEDGVVDEIIDAEEGALTSDTTEAEVTAEGTEGTEAEAVADDGSTTTEGTVAE